MSNTRQNTLDELYKKLIDVENKKQEKLASVKLPKPEYEKIEYDAPTDDELTRLAEQSLKEKYDLKRQQKKTDTDKRVSAFEQLIEQEREKEQQALRENAEKFGKANDKMENELIKRGLQRSSIAIGSIADLENSKIANENAIKNSTTKNVSDIDKKIEELNESFDKSMQQYDFDQAKEINDKIYELKEERRKNQEAATKYNNQVEKEIYNYEISEENAKRLQKLNDLGADYDNEKIRLALEYYLNNFENTDQAYNALMEDYSMQEFLGDRPLSSVKSFLRAKR